MEESRTKKAVRNSAVALTMYFINLILQFLSRDVFLRYLGVEILGLNTTAVNILQFLNLAEMGVWTAIATSLYKPIKEQDFKEVSRIVTFNGIIYKRIAWFIIAVSCIIMCFFPIIFKKTDLPLWYSYASFGVLLFSSIIGYFFNYTQFVLSSSQQNYKVQYTYKLSMSLKVGAQMLAMICFKHPYVWWLILEVIFAIIGSVSLNFAVKRTYPQLKNTKDSYKRLKADYPEIIKKTKQLFLQKLSEFALFQTSPLVIYGIANLTLVALYGNYLLIIQGVISLMASMFNGMLSSIGNLIVSSKKEHIIDVFYQLYSIRFYIISIISVGLWCLGQEFVKFWIGSQYLLPESTLLLMIINLWVYLNRYVVYDFLTAYGYFGDAWVSIIEFSINIGLSIILGINFGLNGIITGTLISNFLMALVWKPIYLFQIKLKSGYIKFISVTTLLTLITITTYFVIERSLEMLISNSITKSILEIFLFAIILFLIMRTFIKPFRQVLVRFIKK